MGGLWGYGSSKCAANGPLVDNLDKCLWIDGQAIHLHLTLYSLWNMKSVPILDMQQHLVVGQALEGEAAKGDHLIEQNTIAPDI